MHIVSILTTKVQLYVTTIYTMNTKDTGSPVANLATAFEVWSRPSYILAHIIMNRGHGVPDWSPENIANYLAPN